MRFSLQRIDTKFLPYFWRVHIPKRPIASRFRRGERGMLIRADVRWRVGVVAYRDPYALVPHLCQDGQRGVGLVVFAARDSASIDLRDGASLRREVDRLKRSIEVRGGALIEPSAIGVILFHKIEVPDDIESIALDHLGHVLPVALPYPAIISIGSPAQHFRGELLLRLVDGEKCFTSRGDIVHRTDTVIEAERLESRSVRHGDARRVVSLKTKENLHALWSILPLEFTDRRDVGFRAFPGQIPSCFEWYRRMGRETEMRVVVLKRGGGHGCRVRFSVAKGSVGMEAESHIQILPRSASAVLCPKPCIDAPRASSYYEPMGEASAAQTQMRTLLSSLPDIVYILDEHGVFLFLNESISMLGYEPAELIGQYFSLIIHPDDRPNISRDIVVERIRHAEKFPEIPPKLFDERRSGERMTRELEVRLLHRDGHIVYATVNAYGERALDIPLISGLEGMAPQTVGVIHDVSAMHLYQQSLEESLSVKERLLREMHHRVKSNLQLVASLAHLQQLETPSKPAEELLRELESRVKSIALVYEALYQAEKVDKIPARAFFSQFCRAAEETLERLGSRVHLHLHADDCALEVERLVPLSLALLELLDGAYVHAYETRSETTISLTYRCEASGARTLELRGESLSKVQPSSILNVLLEQAGVSYEQYPRGISESG